MKTQICAGLIGVVSSLVAVFLTWAVAAETSPFYEYFLWNPVLHDLWLMLNFPVLIVLMITQIDYRPFALLLIFLQWFLIASFGSLVLGGIRRELAKGRLG